MIAKDKKSAEIIRPILRGRDISRYQINFADLYLINTHNGIPSKNIFPVDIEEYPAVKEHLDIYWDKIESRDDQGVTPYNLRSCAYMDDFSKQKIVWGEISDKPKFALDFDGKYYPEATTFILTGKNIEYLYAILNSTISEWFFSNIGTTTGVGTVRWKKFTIEQLLVIPPNEDILQIIKRLLVAMRNDQITCIDFENETERFIYSLYNLDENEINFIKFWSKK